MRAARWCPTSSRFRRPRVVPLSDPERRGAVVLGVRPVSDGAEAAKAASIGAATCAGATTTGTRLTAARPAAVTAVRAGTSAPVTPRRTSSGTVASHAMGPMTRRRSPSEIARNARTMSGSNWVPALSVSSTRACAAGQGLLVRPGRGHHIERVGHRDDATCEGDLFAGQAVRVSVTVEALVVFARGPAPVTQPGPQADEPLVARRRVVSHLLPLFGCELALLVEDLGRYVELADVVQQRGPVQARRALRVETELLADEVGVGPHPFAVPACQAVVAADRPEERDDGFGGLLRRGERLLRVRVRDRTFEGATRAGLQRDREAGGRVIGEHERHAEDRRERQQATDLAVDDPQRERREGHQARPSRGGTVRAWPAGARHASRARRRWLRPRAGSR